MDVWKWVIIIKRIGAAVLASAVFAAAWPAASFAAEEDVPEALGLYALSAVLMDGDTGRILWEKEGETIRPMASTTKIMTCILALEGGLDDDRVVAVSKKAAAQPQVRLGMREGQKFHTRDLLYSLMLESHNDSAVAIAEAAAGSVEEFAGIMNQKARELGCLDTWFITPNGLDETEIREDGKERVHSTTARDLARIFQYCISESPKAEEFLKIPRTSDYWFQDAEGKGRYSCRNHNALLTMMEGAVSGKTGFTAEAGYCYIGAVKDKGRTFIFALLGCGWPPHKTYKWSDARSLVEYGKAHYEYQDIYCQADLEPVLVADGVPGGNQKKGEKPGKAWARLTVGRARLLQEIPGPRPEGTEAMVLPVLLSPWDQVKVVRQVPDYLTAPVEAGKKVGEIVYFINGNPAAAAPVYTAEDVEAFTFGWCMGKAAEAFLGSCAREASSLF